MVLTSTLGCQVVRLKPPSQIVLDGVVHSTPNSHGKFVVPRGLGKSRNRCDDADTRTAYVLGSRQIQMFHAQKEVGERPDFAARAGKLRSEKEVMNLGTRSHVHDRNGLGATRAADESFFRGVRGRRTAIEAAEVGCEAEPAVHVDRDRPIPSVEAQSCAGTARDSFIRIREARAAWDELIVPIRKPGKNSAFGASSATAEIEKTKTARLHTKNKTEAHRK